MRMSHAVLIAAMPLYHALGAGQAPPVAAPAQSQPAAAPTPFGLLQPSLDTVQQALNALRLEKWKKGTVRDAAADHVEAIRKDLQTNLPPLIQDANAAPETISKVLPAYRNIDALYDVLLRVVEASRVSAPADQVTQLEQALLSLNKARRALNDRLQDEAEAQEKQLSDLRSTLQTQSVALRSLKPPPPPAPCPAPAPTRRAKKKTSPPATTPQTPQPAAVSKPGD